MKTRNHDRSPDKTGFSVALPKTLLEEVERIAKAEHRSRNGQIEHFLFESVRVWKESKHLGKDESQKKPLTNIESGKERSPMQRVG